MILYTDSVPVDALLGALIVTAEGLEFGPIVGLAVNLISGQLWAIFEEEQGRYGLPLDRPDFKDAKLILQHPAWTAGGAQ